MGSNLSIKIEFGSMSKTIYIVMNRWTESYNTKEKNRLIHGIKIRKLKIVSHSDIYSFFPKNPGKAAFL